MWRSLLELVERTYDVAALERVTDVRPLSLMSMEQVAGCRVLLDGDPSCTSVVELFLLGAGVEVGRAELGLAPLGVEPLLQAGLLEVDGGVVRARISIVPFDGLWLVGDRLNERGVPRGQRVPNTDLTSLLAASVVSRRAAGSMLDLGTGTGVLALLGARHCGSVTGVDINQRALMFAEFNAGLNKATAAEWIEGEFFDRLEGRMFDVVVANPPFIISPDRDDPHRFGGGAGDALSREVLRGAAAHLNEGGVAYVLCDVGIGGGHPWSDPLRDWVAGTGCDALLLRLSSVSPAAYALVNHDPRAYSSSRAFEKAATVWLESYRSLGITEIAFAVVVLRRRTVPENWAEAFALAGYPSGHVGERIEGLFAGIDHFGTRRAEGLLCERLTVADGHELRQRLGRVDGTYLPEDVQLQFAGFPLIGGLSPEGLPVLFALDGSCDLGAAITGVAEEYGMPESDLNDLLLPQLHELGRRGFLRPAAS